MQLEETKGHGYSLNPGRYVGVAEKEEAFDFYERLDELNEELKVLNSEERELKDRIAENAEKLMERKM